MACSNKITVDELDAVHKQDEELRNEMIRELLAVRPLQNKYELNAQEAKEETENDFAKKSEEKRNFLINGIKSVKRF